jgi:hypothetical protein
MAKVKMNPQFFHYVQLRLLAGAQTLEPIIEAELRDEAKWQDQSGQARRELSATATLFGRGIRMILSHGAPHGVFLERKNFGRYAVLHPYLDKHGAGLVRRVINASRIKKLN